MNICRKNVMTVVGLAVCFLAQWVEVATAQPLIIAHRGASGYRPEHTIEAYTLAIAQGADYVEPDLVSTKDGVLICRHECLLTETTDVAEQFPERKRSLVIDGRKVSGWFAQDFTVDEIKMLRTRERLPYRNHKYDGQFQIPTFEEFLTLISAENQKRERPIGICPELKNSSHHRVSGLPLEERLLKLLKQFGYEGADSTCIIQSFEVENLKRLSKLTDLRLLQLLGGTRSIPADVRRAGGAATFGSMMTKTGLSAVASYAWGIGPAKDLILAKDRNNRLLPPTELITDAHAAGLAVVVYTMRNEPRHLAEDYGGDPVKEYRRWASLKVDGLFTDFPDTAVAALKQ
jgi:glycerophosphoryl diester phosphodiesterase